MAEDLGILQQQLAALRDLRASGERRLRVANGEHEREVEYRNDDELAAAIADLQRRISVLQGAKVQTIRIYSSKGT